MPKKRTVGMPPAIDFYYRAWLAGPKLFGHPNDEERFFHFVRAVRKYSKVTRTGEWLRMQLVKEGNIPTHWIDKAVTWFDICWEYDEACESFVDFQTQQVYSRIGYPSPDDAVSDKVGKNQSK